MAVARPATDSDDLHAVRREAAQWRHRAREAEANAADADQLLDTLLGLVADQVIERMRDQGWIEFHRLQPEQTGPATHQGSPRDADPSGHEQHPHERTPTP